jgi:hypothetical protein
MATSTSLSTKIKENTTPSASRKLRQVLADTFTFIRSREANQALATVTFEELMGDQIKRNGESDASNSSQYTPYAFDPDKPLPAGVAPAKRVNFVGGADTTRPTKIQMIQAMQTEVEAVVEDIKKMPLTTVVDYGDYASENVTEVPPVTE